MSSQFSIFVFVLAMGFVTAGLLNALHRYVWLHDQEDGRAIVLSFSSPLQVIWSIFICTFAGPYLVISNGIHFWRLNLLPVSALFLCAIISLIWSFCSGVFVIEAVVAMGILQV